MENTNVKEVRNETVEKKEMKREKVLRLLRKERSTLSMQQALCIGLLNETCAIKIAQPTKKSTVTEQYIKVQTIENEEGSTIDVNDLFYRRCQEMYESDIKQGTTQKTAKRRMQNNRKIDEIHFYQDVLTMNGFMFDCFETSGKPGTYKFNIIKRVFLHSKLVMGESQIEGCSIALHSYLSELLKRGSVLKLERNNTNVHQIVNNFSFCYCYFCYFHLRKKCCGAVVFFKRSFEEL